MLAARAEVRREIEGELKRRSKESVDKLAALIGDEGRRKLEATPNWQEELASILLGRR
jgi:hypothetical protein